MTRNPAMTRRLYLRALAVWALFLVLATMLGAVREGFITPLIGEPVAHVIGTLLFVAVMLAVIHRFVAAAGPGSRPQDWWLIGLMSLLLTVAFEFLFFHFAMGVPWSVLMENYDVAHGRIWILVLLAEFLGPPAMDWQRRRAV